MSKGTYKDCSECPNNTYVGCTLDREREYCDYIKGYDSCRECHHDNYCGCGLGYEEEFCPYLNHNNSSGYEY